MAGLRCLWIGVMILQLLCVQGLPYSELGRAKRLFECKPYGGDCWGQIPCCGDTHCYWPEGYSLIKSGYCVTCVEKQQLCQRDEMCCGEMICDKGYHLHWDGYCMPRKPLGGFCYRPEQCASNYCSTPRWPAYHGRCAKEPVKKHKKG